MGTDSEPGAPPTCEDSTHSAPFPPHSPGSPRIPFNFLLCLSSCVLLQGDEGPAGPPGVPGLEVSVADQEEVRLLGTELVGTCRQPAGEASNQSENTGSGLRRDTEGECWLTACLTLLGSMWLFVDFSRGHSHCSVISEMNNYIRGCKSRRSGPGSHS